jgi:uncharacterized membrane protein
MPEPADPNLPPPVSPVPDPAPEPMIRSTSSGLPSNVAAALACIPLVGGIVFLILEKRDGFVRFYAMQSILFGAAWILINIACAILTGLFSHVPVIAFILVTLLSLLCWLVYVALFVLMVVSMVKALNNQRWEMPYIGPMASRQIGQM